MTCACDYHDYVQTIQEINSIVLHRHKIDWDYLKRTAKDLDSISVEDCFGSDFVKDTELKGLQEAVNREDKTETAKRSLNLLDRLAFFCP